MQVFLQLILFAVFVYLLHRWNRKQVNSLSTAELITAFAVKCLMGFLYGYIFLKFYGGDDTWYFHRGSMEEQQKLINQPAQFFYDFISSMSLGWYYYLSDLEFWLLSKPMAFLNFLSKGDYFTNSLLYNFFAFWGQLWLFRLFMMKFPSNRTALLIAVFFIPSVVFWSSGIRGDGYLLAFIALSLLYFHEWLHKRRMVSLLYVFIGFAGITILRSVLLFLLVPAFIGWFLSVRFRMKSWKAAAIVYGSAIAIFFGSVFLSPSRNLPSIVVERQEQFFAKKGNTRYELDSLRPDFVSFLKTLPQAINNTLLRPYPREAKGSFQWLAAADNVLLIFLLLTVLWRREKDWKAYFRDPLIVFSILFAVTLIVFIGLVIPFPGAIVRYKMPPSILLYITFACAVRWRKQSN